MTIPELIANMTGPRLSFELLPPVKGSSINTIFSNLDELVVFDPPYINITYHSEELSYVKHADGSLVPAVVRKRPGTVGIAAAIQARYKIDVVPHIICGGFSKQETEDALIDLDFLGIRNLLVLRGDGDKITGRFRSNPRGHKNASCLLEQIMDMNKGIYLDEYIENPNHTNFSIGVAGYPEKHQEAPNMETDLQYLKHKVDKGAEYIVTQMFFDNEVFFNFVKKCREIGINVPIIPGIKPIAVKDHLQILPKVFSVTIPNALASEVQKCTNNAQVKQLGVEWSTQQIKELFSKGFPLAHIYTMGKADNIIDIAKNCL
jgi:methylenetetrahydrofolate reductase (NADPH)